jgi:hypothetical protein
MSDVSQLVEQVRNHPEDIQTRLVLADAWMEQGNLQGQLMLWNAQWEQKAIFDDSYHELRRKCEALQMDLCLSLHAKWGVSGVEFERGYVSSVDVTDLEVWKGLGSATQGELALASKVAFKNIADGSLETWLPHLSASPSLTSLNLAGNAIGDTGTQVLAESPHLNNLTSLDLSLNAIGKDGAQALANSPYLINLRLLDLFMNDVGAEGANALAKSPYLKNLTSLHLARNNIGEDGAKALAKSPYLKKLSSLDLSLNAVGDGGVGALAKSFCLTNLTSLDLFLNDIGFEGAKALAESPNLTNLTLLDLGGNSLGEEGRTVLAQSSFLKNVAKNNWLS